MSQRIETPSYLVSIAELRSCATEVLCRLGLPEDHAAMVAEVIVDADLRGYDDHGVALLGLATPLLQDGYYNPRPDIRILSETESTLLLQADRGFGVMPAMQAMQWCIERAKARVGIACAAVRHAGPVFACAPYVEMAAQAGLIGFACVNSEASMAAPGGRTRLFGTNPLAYAVPAARHYPIVFDMAITATAAGKMKMAALEGRRVPEGLIADPQGHVTTDPGELWPPGGGLLMGSLLPVGWPHVPHKGFGLAMLVDLLAGVLSGGAFGPAATPAISDSGQFYWALDVRAFMPLEEFQERVDAQIDQIKASERVDGVEEIFVPGERGQRRREALLARGTVPLSEPSWNQVLKACDRVGLAPPAVTSPRA